MISSIEETYFSCEICHEEFDSSNQDKVPKILKCGHSSFCKRCLLDMAKRNDNLLKCPICNKKQLCEQFEREIPTNYPLMQLIDELRKQQRDLEAAKLNTPGEDSDDEEEDSDEVDPAVIHIKTESQEINQTYENMNIKINIVLKAILKLKESQKEVQTDKDSLTLLLSQKPNPPQINQVSLIKQLAELKKYSNRINTKILNKIQALKDKQKQVAQNYSHLEKIFNFGEIKKVQMAEQQKIINNCQLRITEKDKANEKLRDQLKVKEEMTNVLRMKLDMQEK